MFVLENLFIKNFKAFEKETIPLDNHNIFIGENDSGKTTILQALDIFFNQEKVEKTFVIDDSKSVEIGVLVNNKQYKKVYKGPTFKEVGAEAVGNFNEIEHLRFIYIPMNSYDPKSLINQLAIAKAIRMTGSELLEQLKLISQDAINQVVNNIDQELLIINHNNTEIIGTENFKYDGAIKFNISTQGIPVEARGSGFQKNLMYALLVGNDYDNVILGVDEIENSLSINNCSSLLHELHSRIGQTLITTHSRKILEIKGLARPYPLFSDTHITRTLEELLCSLDKTNEKKYLLVEGKFDIPWFETALNLLNLSDNYIVLPGGGHNNIDVLKDRLQNLGKTCLTIKDGDTQAERTLVKECIELYTPLSYLNTICEPNLPNAPVTKIDFFNNLVIPNLRDSDSVKRIISMNTNNFLNIDSGFVIEVKSIIETFEQDL